MGRACARGEPGRGALLLKPANDRRQMDSRTTHELLSLIVAIQGHAEGTSKEVQLSSLTGSGLGLRGKLGMSLHSEEVTYMGLGPPFLLTAF